VCVIREINKRFRRIRFYSHSERIETKIARSRHLLRRNNLVNLKMFATTITEHKYDQQK